MEKKIDLLDRQEFVDRMLNVTELLAKRKKNVCYAVNGGWGVGKSFVLDMFEEQAAKKMINSQGLYMVFRYNCWEYDYYEEPLIAIVTAMLDKIKRSNGLLAGISLKDFRVFLEQFLNGIDTGLLLKVPIDAILNRADLVSTMIAIWKTWKKAQKKEYDKYDSFQKALKDLRNQITCLAEKTTLIFVVDELDRCLPEYTIKVLERLHHIFDEIPNVQVVLGVDRQQISRVVNNIYGDETSVAGYLAKFIDFEVYLKRGEMKKGFREMYPDYFGDFLSKDIFGECVDEFYTTLLKDVPMRNCKAIIEKSSLCHSLLRDRDSSWTEVVMCVELFLTFVKCFNINMKLAKEKFDIGNLFPQDGLFAGKSDKFVGLTIMNDIYKKEVSQNKLSNSFYADRVYLTTYQRHTTVYVGDVWGMVLGCYRIVLGFSNDTWQYDDNRLFQIDGIAEYVLEYWNLLKTIS